MAALCLLMISNSRTFRKLQNRGFKWTNPEEPVSIFPTTKASISGAIKSFELPRLREITSTRMGMGLKRLDEDNWLTVDSEYLPEHKLRDSLLRTKRSKVLQCLPNSYEACHELLELVTTFLCSRYPEHFSLTSSPMFTIRNHLTGETHALGPQSSNPLETVARLAMEDFNILMKDPVTGEYTLQASATLFPAGWELEERIGTSSKQ